ncbi:uncharacterized protein LOC134281983 isoform X2 [Saccostrea cucullata]|uniref:uncharacterized protein LOC134281983 isoform X2 n=1 Tax=Saccostrea cuccullata TaxID=36930 RepID=UPI002ED0ECE0
MACPNGWWKFNCSEKCPKGHYGQMCEEKCPTNCTEACHHVHGCRFDYPTSNTKSAPSFLLSTKLWIIAGSVCGMVLIICIFIGACKARLKMKEKNSWRPTVTTYNDENNLNSYTQSSSTCCEPHKSKSSLRLPCKDCAMNPKGRVLVSELPSTCSTISEEESPAYMYSCIKKEEEMDNFNESSHRPLLRQFSSFKSKPKEKNSTDIPFDIDEKYTMVKAGSATDTSALMSPGRFTLTENENQGYFVLEPRSSLDGDMFRESINLDNLPPPRFSVLGTGML